MKTPGVFRIVQNDPWAAPSAAIFIFAIIITTIVILADTILGSLPENTKVSSFIWLTGLSFIYFVGVSLWRVWYVRDMFENGIQIEAVVTNQYVLKSAWTVNLEYNFSGQAYFIEYKQVITEKTKKLLNHSRLILVVHLQNPKRILLRDAYL